MARARAENLSNIQTLTYILGSGSKDMMVSDSKVVFDNEPASYKMMHILGFGER